MWDRPFHTVTTTMLWNAASDDAGSYHDGGNDDTEYDTYGNNGCGENPVPRGADEYTPNMWYMARDPV